jgi:hypothetical protein
MAGALRDAEVAEAVQSAQRPFENADVVSQLFYTKWRADRTFMLLPAGALVQQYLQTMVEFPPRQEPDHYSVSNVLDKVRKKAQALEAAQGGGVK